MSAHLNFGKNAVTQGLMFAMTATEGQFMNQQYVNL